MSVLTPPMPAAPAMPPLYRISVEQYHQMIETGILKSGAPIELIEGLLVTKMTINPPHDYATQTLREIFFAMIPSGWFVNSQGPLTTKDSEPDPDVAIIRGHRRQYAAEGKHPGPENMGLVVEVSDTSLAFDRGTKRRLYARNSVARYWIVNFVDRRVEVYTDPSGPCDEPVYHQQRDYGPGDEVPVVLDGQEVGHVRVSDLLL